VSKKSWLKGALCQQIISRKVNKLLVKLMLNLEKSHFGNGVLRKLVEIFLKYFVFRNILKNIYFYFKKIIFNIKILK
jgi:hypothetical protein